jgi:Ubiquitin carboxyl-terminal hydrolase, family 1.
MSPEATPSKSVERKWFPLESNPDNLNKYIANLGFDTSLYRFTDVFSTEDWALEMIPPGTVAVVFLYPLSDIQEKFRREENEILQKEESMDSSVWHIKQRIGNACGTIGILHALANIPEALKVAAIPSDSWLGKFYSSCPAEYSSIKKAEILEADKEIESKHDAATCDEQNQTNRGAIDDQLETHFVAIVNVNGYLYELDGRKEKPVLHGETTAETFLKDSAKVVQKFMERDPDEVRFTILALAPCSNE